MSVREPAVAGMFYPAGAAELKQEVESCFLGTGGPGGLPSVNPEGLRKIVGLVSPHAGFIYSGSVAAWAYHRLAEDGLPKIAVLIGPNHRSYFPAVALSDESAWRTPIGEVELDAAIAAEIASSYADAKVEPSAHRAEHSLEVQLPFLQYIAGAGIRIVPILIGASARSGDGTEAARELGGAIADALRGKDAVVIASTDFTHYESSEAARAKDLSAISKILELDEDGLLDTVEALDISMCGALPTAATIAASKKLGAASARRLAYRNSGDVTGDYAEVVGYAALEIRK
ncbi:MAG TPA: AmmeMemoRadiSam system protein B [Armatimonadota bacterium]|nr:AmmeMemoRadiSam system protein B [Armatimonadota bacterium]